VIRMQRSVIMRKFAIVLALATSLGMARASSSPLDCSGTQAGNSASGREELTVTCVGSDEKLIPGSLVVFRVDQSAAAGTAATRLPVGSQAESATGGLRSFTARVAMPLPGSIGARLVVSAALRGQLRRVLSEVRVVGSRSGAAQTGLESRRLEAGVDRLGVFRGLLPPHPNAQGSTTVNFDELQDGTSVANLEPGLQFSNATALVAGISLNEFEFPPHSNPNVAGDQGGPITITFSQPVYSAGGYFTYASPVSVKAFDASGNQLAFAVSQFSNNLALSGVAGSTPNELVQVQASSPIKSVTLTGDPAGLSFAVDACCRG